jgi:hypothetical protein
MVDESVSDGLLRPEERAEFRSLGMGKEADDDA